jgi:hypothetical protein
MPLRAGLLRNSVAGFFAVVSVQTAFANEPSQAPIRSFATTMLRASILPETDTPKAAEPPPAASAIRPASGEPEAPASPTTTRSAAQIVVPPPSSAPPSPPVQPVALSQPIQSARDAASAAGGHGALNGMGRVLPPPVTEPSWPRTLVEVRRAKEAPKPNLWSKAEIENARQACIQLLKGLDVVALPVEPFRDGDCGAPAAVQLVSLGRSPEVTFSPPPVMTCEMVAGLGKWLGEIQPSARRYLGAPLIRIEVMSSYSCRNAYGRRDARLSEHGRANALDISAFLTSVGYETAVLDHWGPTQRMARRAPIVPPLGSPGAQPIPTVVAAPGSAQPAPPPNFAAARSIVQLPSNPAPAITPAFVANRPVAAPPPVAVPGPVVQPPSPVVAAQPEAPSASGTFTAGVRALTGSDPFRQPEAMSLMPMSRLGGPRSLLPDDVPSDAKAKFLRDIHVSGCRIFGTVLGPEANRAHENHFHVDMAERRTGSFCE